MANANHRLQARIALDAARRDPGEALGSFLDACSDVLRQSQDPQTLENPDFNDRVLQRIETVHESLRILALEPGLFSQNADSLGELTNVIQEIRTLIETCRPGFGKHSCPNGLTSLHLTGDPGRPKIFVSKDQIHFLRGFNFSWVQIQSILGISQSSLYRRRSELGLTGDDVPVTNEDLYRLTRNHGSKPKHRAEANDMSIEGTGIGSSTDQSQGGDENLRSPGNRLQMAWCSS